MASTRRWTTAVRTIRSTRLAALALVGGSLCLVAGMPAAHSSPTASSGAADLVHPSGVDAAYAVRTRFEDAGSPGTPVLEVRNDAAKRWPGIVVSEADGEIDATVGARGRGLGIDLPPFDPGSQAPRAMVAISDLKGVDSLSPGLADFEFGADFSLDAAPTESHDADSTDNGDNLVQRGLADEPTQYKIQLDGRVPSCYLRLSPEDQPEVMQSVAITDPLLVPVLTGWYRVRCVRTSTALTLTLVAYDATGKEFAKGTATTPLDKVLDLTWADRSVPFSVGGKLRPGGFYPDADQFNGLIDNVMFRTLPPAR